MWLSCGKIALRESVTRTTVLRWVNEGVYEKVKKTYGGHYRIWIDSDEEKLILYARVSSAKQKTSIETQKRILLKAFPDGSFSYDIASGFNFERRGFKSILERAINGTNICLVATTQDRITRVGYSLIKRIVELSGGRIILLEEEDNSEQFDTAALIGFITSFINSHYGKRSAKRRSEKDSGIEKDQDIS